MAITGKIINVSLGPGNPELITVKSLKTLQESTSIYCPGTADKNGNFKSRSLTILRALPVDTTRIHCFPVPMSKDRTEANRMYDQIALEIQEKINKGEIVSITAEGDSGFYSSGNYLFEKLSNAGIPITTSAGIPAFIAAGALAGLHIVKQEEKLIVLPGTVSSGELQGLIEKNYVIVIMKLSQCTDEIHRFIAKNPSLHVHYFENIGTTGELYYQDKEEIMTKEFPYFSLMIIKK
ncbi:MULTISPECIES: precorrin-2 C(20)-methyltransferase [Sanguibacteroides]|uniref:Precorrin-2 C20-methyltransferase n=1 Tax=Sanguibacteroides justesenii TaxID=1547597 RepID=A0A0C3NDU8_9PORP|nr:MULTISPECIES: precorrin-2 C(20)-methyltransferase [Sanguibacteroides]KIO44282.1 precorrin-2 C20-methyltransferase [Sanguibacteroides justesenii]KIO45501.1 precorrin-2 C20-methyltransferase [Sanguibacteroides justesenii]PXZ44787.1 precorrin-2 C(20)-methyltransferase [Sanguibacteroides justesenii]